jgi:cbb3-type cytochrome oxidase subunit 3
MFEHLKEHLPMLQYAHLLWGFGLFVGLTLWVYWPSRKQDMQAVANSILRDDDQPTLSTARGDHVAKH